jgi:hypothetical protein
MNNVYLLIHIWGPPQERYLPPPPMQQQEQQQPLRLLLYMYIYIYISPLSAIFFIWELPAVRTRACEAAGMCGAGHCVGTLAVHMLRTACVCGE